MNGFTRDALQRSIDAKGILFPPHVLDQVVAAIDAGKHLILTGPPGTGKTTLAYVAAEVAQKAMLCTGYLPTTATSEWTTFETIGGLQPTAEGLIYRPGLFVEAIMTGRWLVIDELNRSNFDRAFGQLFTVLSGSPVVLPFKRSGQPQPISIVPSGIDPPDDTDVIRMPASWRIIATMNVFDKNLLFEMSYALMRRFAFIEVGTPDEDAYVKLLQGPGEIVTRLLPLRRFSDLGPAVFLDAARYAARRAEDGTSESRLLYEVFYAYFLPQFEGMDDDKATALYRTVEPLFDEPERLEAQRTIGEVLGIELSI
ncbi:AAA family ATPase [Actinomarinicola tropica]|uniref:AAA domain-containing protein n=1 Tax=Actinomarinicola tropica TaxID=2789776 RepID=A0A5Q2REI1_9ACTN|nr:AAA family ATPase [Actinomarinicola tropica]QGG95328.1 AAA domain-containing protein [Actinomarinicola tropica]